MEVRFTKMYRKSQKTAINEQINALDKRIINIANDYADGNLSVTVFNTMNQRFEDQKNELVMQHATFAKVPADFNHYISYSCGLLQNLSNYWVTALPSTQNKLIGLIYPENVTFTGEEYKTTKTNEVFSLITNMGLAFKQNRPAKNARPLSL